MAGIRGGRGAAVGGALLLRGRAWLCGGLGVDSGRSLARFLAGILHGVLIGLIVIRLFRLVTLRLLGDLAVLHVGRRTGLAPLPLAPGWGWSWGL